MNNIMREEPGRPKSLDDFCREVGVPDCPEDLKGSFEPDTDQWRRFWQWFEQWSDRFNQAAALYAAQFEEFGEN